MLFGGGGTVPSTSTSDSTIDIKQEIPDGTSDLLASIKSETMDDVLEILIRNGGKQQRSLSLVIQEVPVHGHWNGKYHLDLVSFYRLTCTHIPVM